MNKLEQAARQALEALIKANHFHDYEDEITALREALAEQAEQEPVATMEVFSGWGDEANFEQLPFDLPDGVYKLYAAPVRTKDLTDDEIMKINVDTAGIVPTCDRQFHFASAVIAADRELNK